MMRCAPKIKWPVDLLPADLCAEALVSLSLQPSSNGKFFHLLSPTMSARRIFRHLIQKYTKIELVSYAAWRDKLLNHVTDKNPLFALTDTILYEFEESGNKKIILSSATVAAVKSTGIQYDIADIIPQIDLCLEFLQQSNFFVVNN